MNCLDCERMREERDRTELAYVFALNTIRDNPGGDNQQRMLLRAMAQEAKIDRDLAIAELLQHQDSHAVRTYSAAAGPF